MCLPKDSFTTLDCERIFMVHKLQIHSNHKHSNHLPMACSYGGNSSDTLHQLYVPCNCKDRFILRLGSQDQGKRDGCQYANDWQKSWPLYCALLAFFPVVGVCTHSIHIPTSVRTISNFKVSVNEKNYTQDEMN